MKLQPGQPAPVFVRNDLDERSIALEQYRGKKVLLSFYRYASCPFCNLRIHQLGKKAPQWQAQGLEMLAVFQSPRSSILEYAGREPGPFTIIPDPQRELYRLYGVEGSWLAMAKGGLQLGKLASSLKEGMLPGKMEGEINMVPADFIIDESGNILLAYYGKDISDHVPESEIERVLG